MQSMEECLKDEFLEALEGELTTANILRLMQESKKVFNEEASLWESLL